jgi:translation initiation factor eIF-2B subunit delta
LAAQNSGKKIRVIIVDSAPDFLGRSLAKRLSAQGIKCQYTMINMVNFLIKTVTKVMMASTYVLCNGALVAPIGTSQIGCIAYQNQIPVVVVCETYKFADRVNLDQINNNEQGSA